MTNPKESIHRFVVLCHTRGDNIHWDLMIEQGDHLSTWRLPIAPRNIADYPILLEKLFDHPLRFLSYEGPVQNQTGSVTRCDQGIVYISQWDERQIGFRALGDILKGRFHLCLIENTLWRLKKVQDRISNEFTETE
ncbi:MAG: hypothetical protein JXA82_19535 [Sedimentisphaerales bacterium]|nr:hypothetical protein [Sedimentisphaerales bacterium]